MKIMEQAGMLKKILMISYDIPDPFIAFVSKQTQFYQGAIYDFFAKEWNYTCSSCNQLFYAPTKKTITKTRLYHTRNECLNGY